MVLLGSRESERAVPLEQRTGTGERLGLGEMRLERGGTRSHCLPGWCEEFGFPFNSTGDEQLGGRHARQWRDLIYVLTKGLWLGTVTQVRTEAVEMEVKRQVRNTFWRWDQQALLRSPYGRTG